MPRFSSHPTRIHTRPNKFTSSSGSVTTIVSGQTKTTISADRALKARKGEAHSLLDLNDADAECGERAKGEETKERVSGVLMILLEKGVQTKDVSLFLSGFLSGRLWSA